MEQLARAATIVLLSSVATVASTDAQTPVSVDDRVRVYDARGNRLTQGTVRSIDPDSIVVGSPAATVATESFRSGGYRLSRQTGTHALEGAVGTGAVLGLVVGSFAYCFQIFGGGCVGNMDAAVKDGIGALAVGAAIGGLIGAAIPKYENVDVGPYGGRVTATIEPRVSSQPLGLSLSVRWTGR